MSSSTHPTIRLFATDLDGTIIGNPESTQRFRVAWESLDPTKRPLLVYATGRSVSDTMAVMASQRLPRADYIIGSVGTELIDPSGRHDFSDYIAQFGEGWDLQRIEEIVTSVAGIERQPPEFLHPYKSSWYWNRVDREQLSALQQRLDEAGLQVNLVYSSLRFLDVLPRRANKGNALTWLCARLNIPLEETLVAGDTGNDSSMFLLPGVKGIVVENAQPELFEAV